MDWACDSPSGGIMVGASRGKWKVLAGITLTLLVLAGGLAWRERTTLRCWYCLRGLARTNAKEKESWIGRVVSLGEPAIPGLLEGLTSPNPLVCQNHQEALDRMCEEWGAGDSRSVGLVSHLAHAFGKCGPAGQKAALEVPGRWFLGTRKAEPAPGLMAACSRLLSEGAQASDPEVQAVGLILCEVLLQQPEAAEVQHSVREFARAGLKSPEPANRLRAVRLSLRPGMDLLDQVSLLLADPSVEVRRAALIAVAPANDVVGDEGLLPCLHDTDPEMRKLCEAALKGRGLRPDHIQLGRLLTHPLPVQRLRVLDYLRWANDLDPGLWLRRLSHDPSPAVRAAALRAMSHQELIDLQDRIDQMARNDPSPSVCQLAKFYKAQPNRKVRGSNAPADSGKSFTSR
jgi:hypothetical protein